MSVVVRRAEIASMTAKSRRLLGETGPTATRRGSADGLEEGRAKALLEAIRVGRDVRGGAREASCASRRPRPGTPTSPALHEGSEHDNCSPRPAPRSAIATRRSGSCSGSVALEAEKTELERPARPKANEADFEKASTIKKRRSTRPKRPWPRRRAFLRACAKRLQADEPHQEAVASR